jgi:HK97 family phage prohead protease
MKSHTSLPADNLEVRAAPAASVGLTDDRLIRGYPIVFNTLSQDLGGFRERILPEAVDRSMNADIRALVDHDTAKVLGRTRSGTLALKKDKTGLRVSIDPDTEISYAKDIMRAVARGDVSGMSFGFRVIEEDWHYEDKKIPIRDILDMEIAEFSIVTFPAYTDTNVEVATRSLKQFQQTHAPYDWRSKWHEITTIAK